MLNARKSNDDINFGKHIARLGDIYVNDAFSCSHRAHSSICEIPKFLPSYSGFLLQKEMEVIKNLSN